MIHPREGYFYDDSNRILVLRGVNLGGSSKVPFTPNGASWNKNGFYNHREVSFVGRPFPLEEADEHFRRLKHWGFNFLRFLITWEAIEHAGPGQYDEAYLDYIHTILKKAAEYGLDVFIDPHQDVWSRFTGGDGAPGWTLEAAGMDISRIHRVGAAFVHQESGDPYPKMIWPTNYNKLAAATMFTLFFAGRDFAPNCLVDGISIQDYLQDHYIQSVLQVVERVKDLPNVVGYDTLNEPSCGFIGQGNLHTQTINQLKLGPTPTLYQSMLLASGISQDVDVYKIGLTGFVRSGITRLNSKAESLWLPEYPDIWLEHGVWGYDSQHQPVLLQPDYFSKRGEQSVHFNSDYFKPFVHKFAQAVRAIHPEALLFVEEIPDQIDLDWSDSDPDRIVLASHWYDNVTLVKKTFLPWFTVDVRSMKMVLGGKHVRQNFVSQIADLKNHAIQKMKNAPLVVGEVGIPFDLDQKKAYRTGDESTAIQAYDATMNALESNFVSFTLWNYTSDNTNERGDQWNDEDLSIFSRDQMHGTDRIDDGGRSIRAVVRPYPQKIAGEPVMVRFDMKNRLFEFEYRHQSGIQEPTQVFVPQTQYPQGCGVVISDGRYELDLAEQRLLHWPSEQMSNHRIQILPK
jgi:hypothetical protein